MIERAIFRARWRIIIPILALLFAIGLSAQAVFAGRLTDTTAGLQKQSPAATSSQPTSQNFLKGASTGLLVAPKSAAQLAPTIPDSKVSPSRDQVQVADAYMSLEPSIDHFG